MDLQLLIAPWSGQLPPGFVRPAALTADLPQCSQPRCPRKVSFKKNGDLAKSRSRCRERRALSCKRRRAALVAEGGCRRCAYRQRAEGDFLCERCREDRDMPCRIRSMSRSSRLRMDAWKLRWGGGRYGRSGSCNHLFSRTLFDVLSTLQAELIGLDESRKEFSSSQAPNIMIAFAERPKGPLSACKKDGLYDYYLMTYLHGQLLIDDPIAAVEFKRRSLNESLSDQAQLRFSFDHVGESPAKLALLGPHDIRENPFPEIIGTAILRRGDARYFVLEKRVNFGDVCEAARILFQELKGGEAFDLAIEYMINSPRLDPNVKYGCGDAAVLILAILVTRSFGKAS